jgi:hypothetical protein
MPDLCHVLEELLAPAYQLVEALYLGFVPGDHDEDPEALSVEPKSG